jgi:hypothetical protein
MSVKEKPLKFKCEAYHHIAAGIVPGCVELLDGTLELAQVLRRTPWAGRVDNRKLVLAQAAGNWRQVRLMGICP